MGFLCLYSGSYEIYFYTEKNLLEKYFYIENTLIHCAFIHGSIALYIELNCNTKDISKSYL
jgi:hypothetical protein